MKSKWLQLLLCIIVIDIFVPFCHAQNPAIDSTNIKVSASLIACYKKYPQEKIFIHTSQSVYTGGQTIWYALYAAAYGKPSLISKIAYVQLLNSDGKVVIQNKLPLTNGTGTGNIDLPDSIRTGWYQLRGFTSWMMNFGEGGYFHQNMYIQNTADAIHNTQPVTAAAKYHVSFFPEGGDLTGGQICYVAFKAVDDSGSPVAINGQVTGSDNQLAAQIITTHDGMGIFRLDVSGNNYSAIIHFPDNTTQTILLPQVKNEGIAIHANTASATDIQLRIAYSGTAEKYKNVLLAAFQNNGTVITYPLVLGRGLSVFNIKKNLFSTGIVRLTLFNNEQIPLAERLIFVDNHDNLTMQLKADTFALAPHKKQVFSLTVNNDAAKFSGGNFSVAVTDAEAFAKDSADNILTAFLLSSELRGPVNDPAWYFQNDDTMQLLDLVMMTNGWRHFNWDKILGGTSVNLQYPVEGSQFIAGKIENYQKPIAGKPQDVIKLLIINQDSSRYIGYVTPDSLGRFILKDYHHSGTATLFMETTDTKNRVKKLQIKLLNTLNDSLKNAPAMPLTLNESAGVPVTSYLLSKRIMEKQALLQTSGIVLQTVRIKSKKENPTDKVIASHVNPLYHSITEYTLDLVNNPAPDISLIEYIQGKFPGLQIIIDPITNTAVFIYLSTSTIMTQPQPYIYLNETQTKFDGVKDINLHNVALIRFIPPPVGFAPYNGGSVGALMIYTKKGSDELATIESREKFDQYTFNGYSITREFSSPDYSTIKNNIPPDDRTTLYWNPHLRLDSDGKVKIHFYNSDNAKSFRVIIQGMDADGKPGYLDEVFKDISK